MAKAKHETTKENQVFIDRIEDHLAVLTLSENDEIHFELPVQFLPAESKAGDWLKLIFAIDDESTAAARNRVAALQSELTKENESETNIKL